MSDTGCDSVDAGPFSLLDAGIVPDSVLTSVVELVVPNWAVSVGPRLGWPVDSSLVTTGP